MPDTRRLFDAALEQPHERREDFVRARARTPAMANDVLDLLRYVDVDPFEALDPRATLLDRPGRGSLLAERYRLHEPIGSGAQSQVFRARDELQDRWVAVKLLRRACGDDLAHESAALRQVRIEGVVRLFEHGRSGQWGYLVTELAEGAPFPNASAPTSWDELRPLIVSTLETLGRVHALGLIHGDLKPSNLCVVSPMRTLLFDFGVAAIPGWRLAAARGMTPGFAAPEQLGGEPLDARADLYSLGRVGLDALGATDGPPARDPTSEERRGLEFLSALAVEERDQRPSSAAEALRWLRGSRRELVRGLRLDSRANPRAALDLDELRALVRGPERLFRVRTDLAAELLRRTGGQPRALEDLVATLVRAGLASFDGEQIHMTREELDRWRQGLADPKVARTTREARGRRDISLAEVAPRPSPLPSRPSPHAGHAPSADDSAIRARYFHDWILRALEQLGPLPFDRLRLELEREEPRSPRLEHYLEFVDAAQACYLSDPRRTLARLESLAPLADPALEGWRQSLRIQACGGGPRLKQVVASACEWARTVGTDEALARRSLWRGRLAYVEGDFDEAARRHERAAELAPLGFQRLTARTNAASAWLDAGRVEAAVEQAEAAAREAAEVRSPALLARTEWLLRSARYRLGQALEPDEELVEEVALLAAHPIEGLVCLGEAAIAWRAGDAERTRAWTARAATAWRTLGNAVVGDLADALGLAAGTDSTQAPRIAERALAGPGPLRVRAQTLSLIARATDSHAPRAAARPRAAPPVVLPLEWLADPALRPAVARPDQRWEVLAYREFGPWSGDVEATVRTGGPALHPHSEDPR